MPDTDAHPPSIDLQGTWRGEVHFTAGPNAGDIHHESYLFADDGILVVGSANGSPKATA